jgi:hypothetical protein
MQTHNPNSGLLGLSQKFSAENISNSPGQVNDLREVGIDEPSKVGAEGPRTWTGSSPTRFRDRPTRETNAEM